MKESWAGVFLFTLLLINASAETESLDKLANDFWTWRAKYAPFTADDVNRIERPGGVRDWSRSSIDSQRKDLAEFETRWKKLDANTWPIPQQVDYRLIGSALARVRWELDINPRWKRDPNFYVAQTLTPVVEALTVPGPYDAARSREILTRIENIPSILQQGVENLDKPPAPFATVAIQALENIRSRLRQVATALLKSTTLKEQELNSATDRAADALDRFREKLREMLPSLPNETALGRDAYVFFLKNVALIPYSPEALLAMDRQEWNRAIAFEAFEKNRNKNVSPLKIANNIDDWIKDATAKELQIRKFLAAGVGISRRRKRRVEVATYLIDDFEAHLPGGAGDDTDGGFVVARVEVFALGVHDVHDLFARDFAHFGFVRLFGAGSDVGCFL